jgi:hypothetical protein
MKNKKGQIMNNLSGLAVGVAVLAITLTVAFLVIGEGREEIGETYPCENTSDYFNDTGTTSDGQGYCCHKNGTGTGAGGANEYNCSWTQGLSAAWNGTNTLGSAVDDIPGWVPLIVIGVVGALLLGLVALFRR